MGAILKAPGHVNLAQLGDRDIWRPDLARLKCSELGRHTDRFHRHSKWEFFKESKLQFNCKLMLQSDVIIYLRRCCPTILSWCLGSETSIQGIMHFKNLLACYKCVLVALIAWLIISLLYPGPYPLTKDIKLGFQPKPCIRKTELRPDVFNHIVPVSTSCRFTLVEQTVYSYKNRCQNIIAIIYSNKWYEFRFWTYSVSTTMNSYHILFTQIQHADIFLLISYTWPAVVHMQMFVFFQRALMHEE